MTTINAVLILGKVVPEIEKLVEISKRAYPTITHSQLVFEEGEDFIEYTFFDETHYYHICLSDIHYYFKAYLTEGQELEVPELLEESI